MALSGQITVTTAGTAVQSSTSVPGHRFMLKGHSGNTNNVYIGDTAAGAAAAAGYHLQVNGEVEVILSNINVIWVDADTNGNKLSWIKID